MILALLAAAAHAHPEWTGAYILEMSTVTRADVPVLGETVTTTHSVMLTHITAGPDGGWLQTHRVCDVRIEDPTNLARTVLLSLIHI